MLITAILTSKFVFRFPVEINEFHIFSTEYSSDLSTQKWKTLSYIESFLDAFIEAVNKILQASVNKRSFACGLNCNNCYLDGENRCTWNKKIHD